MNTNLANFIVGLVIDENDRFYFVQKDGQTYALAKEEGEHQLGESVKGFAYTDMKQKLRLTTIEVTATQESFGWGTVTEVRKDLGVFVDTGLPDKEIVVSLDILPELKELWPKKGDKLFSSLLFFLKILNRDVCNNIHFISRRIFCHRLVVDKPFLYQFSYKPTDKCPLGEVFP